MNKTKLISLFSTLFSLIFLVNSKGNEISTEKDESRISVIVIDPGHGGKDWGASVGNAKEKDIVLDIALQLGNTIKTNYPEIKIVYTRSKDIFIPLHQRANIANKSEADLFISIHVNSVEQKWVQGTETFVLGQHRSKDNLEVAKKENAVILLEDDYSKTYEGFDPNSPESYIMFELVQDEYLDQSVMFASDIQNQFKEQAKRVDRSVKQAGFLVLRRTTMPSVLIETGFLSHSQERIYLTSKLGKTNLSSAIFRAFVTYKKKIEDKSSFNLITENATVKTPEKKPDLVIIEKPKIEKQKEVEKTNNIYFSVQIMALKSKLETTQKNFTGETNVFIIESNDFNRYYLGKFNSLEAAQAEMLRIQKKYSNAFVVAFENNELISVKKALGKM
ncbi:MAG: N-acetylmuramoyl-L-alanine amidase [Bacteroidetes bacterium]|nr:N-acetylmuramoyl-L-alanine amidase [Bacteroidota bacterium]